MDLHPIQTPPSADEVAAILSVLVPALGPEPERPPGSRTDDTYIAPPIGRSAAEAQRHLLLPVLHALQRRCGWISPGGLGEACRRLSIPPAEGYGVASFYALFSLTPRPATVVHVCEDIACKAHGADSLRAALRARLGPAGEESRGAPGTTWLASPCLGLCERAPAAMLQVSGNAPHDAAWGPATEAEIVEALTRHTTPTIRSHPPQQAPDDLRLLRRVGVVDPTSLGAYRASGGYRALRRAIEIGPTRVIREITEAKLTGRGGAAFPTGRKWAAVAGQPVHPHWLVCNADESEPGTFKDRVLLEGDPFAIVEAMTIAGLTTGCPRGILYIRAEYPLATERIEHAIREARNHGLLGPDILGRGLSFEIEVRRGAGAYICGEETALFNSIEGLRGEPRSKPPFPVEVGLFGKPTLVNNVETLANVPGIVLGGGAAFAAVGTPGSTGTRLFCLSGHVARPGIYEVPCGTLLSELLALAGGVAGGTPPGTADGGAGGRTIKTVLLGGAAGTFLGPQELDVPLTFEDTRKIGATLGSGVVVVLDDRVDLVPHLQRLAGFFRDESCGQCVPCRVGTVRQEELLGRLARRSPQGSWAEERTLLAELGQCMRDASICGLGQTASNAVESAIQKFSLLEPM